MPRLLRFFVCSILLPAVANVFLAVNECRAEEKDDAAASSQKLAAFKEARQKAANRTRRIIYNDDGGNVTRFGMESATPEGVLKAGHYDRLLGSQIDSIFYCTKSSGFGVFTHFTKIGSLFMEKGAEGEVFAKNATPDLFKAGIDPLTVTVEFCKKNKIEVFWSMRMNDTHDGTRTDYGPLIMRANKIKLDHPEWLLGEKGKKLKHGKWSAVDYGRAEIRDYAYRFFEEVCTNYDVDGIELDFTRHPVFFQSTARGETATDEERAQMTDLLKRIHAMTERIGSRRGRPILVAVRLFDSVGHAYASGLDLESWLKQNLVDLLVTGGYVQLNSFEYSVALARKYGVKIYPSLDEPRMKNLGSRKIRESDLSFRARASLAWNAGADGIYIFNGPLAGNTNLYRELGDPALLAKLDRDYFASVKGIGEAAGGNYPVVEFQKYETLSTNNPKPINAGEKSLTRIELSGSSDKTFDNVTLELRLRFESVPNLKSLSVKFNDGPLILKSVDQEWLEATIPTSLAKHGTNVIELNLAKQAAKPVLWTDAMVELRVKK